MKRGKLALLLVVALFVVSGCGKEKELSCTMEASELGINMKYSIDTKFKGDKVEDMNVTLDIEYPEETTEEQSQLYSSTFKPQFEAQGFTVEEKENGLKLTAGKDSEFFSTYGIDLEGKAKYEDAKKTFETSGFTCK